jgi:hypothetical protein
MCPRTLAAEQQLPSRQCAHTLTLQLLSLDLHAAALTLQLLAAPSTAPTPSLS